MKAVALHQDTRNPIKVLATLIVAALVLVGREAFGESCSFGFSDTTLGIITMMTAGDGGGTSWSWQNPNGSDSGTYNYSYINNGAVVYQTSQGSNWIGGTSGSNWNADPAGVTYTSVTVDVTFYPNHPTGTGQVGTGRGRGNRVANC